MDYERQEATIVAAQESLKAGRAALLNKAGERIYSDAEHGRRTWELDRGFRQTLAQVSRAAADQASEAEAILAEGPENPLLSLSAAELERANQLRAFVGEDAQTLPLRELVERVEGALRDGDRALLFLYQRGVTARFEPIPKDGYGLRVEARDSADRKALVTLETLLGRLGERLTDPAKKAKRERAEAEAREKRSASLDRWPRHQSCTSVMARGWLPGPIRMRRRGSDATPDRPRRPS